MKHVCISFLCYFLIFFVVGCSKEKTENGHVIIPSTAISYKVTINGFLQENCAGSPKANEMLVLLVIKSSSASPSFDTIFTGVNGDFSATYQYDYGPSVATTAILISPSDSQQWFLSSDTFINILLLHQDASSLNVHLSLAQPLTQNDTLFFGMNSPTPIFSITGPLSDSTFSFPWDSLNALGTYHRITYLFFWGIGRKDYEYAQSVSNDSNRISFDHTACINDTLILTR